MVWNVFLAFLPLVFSLILSYYYHSWGTVRKSILGFLWLIFFPNSPYMITDFIHISGNNFFLSKVAYNDILNSTNMTLWIRIAYIGIGMLTGLLSGLLSFRIINQLLREKFGQVFSHVIVMLICILTGYGIFLGRFLRLNSWSLLKAAYFFQKLASINLIFILKFTIIYAFFVYMIYFVFCSFYPKTDIN
jgi:uncharacterized membrane protein